jgi:hypothetical protein
MVQRFIRIFFRGAVGLTVVLVMAAAYQVQAAPTPDHSGFRPLANSDQSEKLLLAQKTEPAKQKQPCPPPKEPEQLKSVEPPQPQPEQMQKRSRIILDEPQKAGTKKIGGQTIRAKGTPGEE